MQSVSRRAFVLGGAAAISASNALPAAIGLDATHRYKVDDQVAFGGQTRRLKLTNGDRYIASLIFATDYPTHFRLKPELYPVCTPAGVPVTETHPFSFIHHQSISTGHGRVRVDGADRDVDFYRQLPYPVPDRVDPFHKSKNLFHLGPSGIQVITDARWTVSDRIVLELAIQWLSRDEASQGAKPLVTEKRRYEVFQRGPYTFIDQFSQLRPAASPFTLKADRHSFVSVRVHDVLDPDEGGVMRDSLGRMDPDGNYWEAAGDRQAPKWIDCTGTIGANRAGIALLSHPQNVRSEFYCRSWGLMNCSAMLGHDARVTREQPFRFAARFVAHDGDLAHTQAEQLYQQFANRPME